MKNNNSYLEQEMLLENPAQERPLKTPTQIKKAFIIQIFSGILLLILTEYLKTITLTSYMPKSLAESIPLIYDPIKIIAYLLIGIGVACWVLRDVVEYAWDSLIAIYLTHLTNSVDNHLSIISEKTKHITDNFNNLINNKNGDIVTHNWEDENNLEYYNKILSRKIYGHHSGETDSLFYFAKHWICTPFCKQPHRSKVKKKVTISPFKDNNNYVRWHEITEFKIHNTQENSENFYNLDISISSFAPDMHITNWSKAVSLSIKIDHEFILTKDDSIKEENNTINEGFFGWKEDDWITIRFSKKIILTKMWTDVYIDELSINSREDKTYSLNIYSPVYGHSIDFILPDEYIFIKTPYISSKLLYMGLPQFVKNTIKETDIITIDKPSDNHIRIDVKKWILPGILLSLDWVEAIKDKSEC